VTTETLESLERRVGQKWAAAAAARIDQRIDPQWNLDVGSWGSAAGEGLPPLPPGTPQFPREQWASYPTARRVALQMCEHLLDNVAELTDNQWMLICVTMQYGGKTRIA
jgi:hypothetical protein